jgi:hypothetical protein
VGWLVVATDFVTLIVLTQIKFNYTPPQPPSSIRTGGFRKMNKLSKGATCIMGTQLYITTEKAVPNYAAGGVEPCI